MESSYLKTSRKRQRKGETGALSSTKKQTNDTSTETPRLCPLRSVNDVLAPQKTSSFVQRARYKANPKAAWIEIDDLALERLAPVTIIRDVLPASMATRMLQVLQVLSETWTSAQWIVHGKQHIVPRTSCSYRLDDPIEAGEHTNTEHREIAQEENSVNVEFTEYDTELQQAPPEISEAARIIRDAVRQRRPWQTWDPTFALANKYRDGAEAVGFHSDHIMDLGPRPIIVGLTLGACRRFDLRGSDRTTEIQETAKDRRGCDSEHQVVDADSVRHISIPLPHNSAIVMWNDAQENWQHAVPRCANTTILRHPKSGLVRFSLTFRMKKYLPNLGKCNCGKQAGLKAKRGMYYLFCKPYGKDKVQQCNFWKRCQWAENEARRLKHLEQEPGEDLSPRN